MNLKKVYEDAVMAGGDAGGAVGGDVVAPSSGDTGEITSKGTSYDDVLGKYDPSGKWMGTYDNFFKPVNVFGKGKMLRRYEILAGKKGKKDNPYAKGMKIIETEMVSDDILDSIQKKTSDDMLKFAKRVVKDAKEVKDVAYFTNADRYFFKVLKNDRKTVYITAMYNSGKFDENRDFSKQPTFSKEDVEGLFGGDLDEIDGLIVWTNNK